ncbi:GNAT family N-acetyltransferase [Bacillota bacterium Lsc_1132]
MIRKLTENDHPDTFAFLMEEPSINLFVLGDIEAFGYHSDFQEIWAEFDEDSKIKAVLLRYYQSYIAYAKGDFDVKGFADIIQNGMKPYQLSGKSLTVEKFERILPLGKKQQTHFAECRTLESLTGSLIPVKQAGLEDVDRIIELRKTISEFQVKNDAQEILIQSMKANTSRTYYTERNGLMTSCVSTAAENSLSAMIVGVCTKKEYRKQGLASAIMGKLFLDVLNEGKILCLFYDNPEAGRIYKRLGFKDIGLWTMYR